MSVYEDLYGQIRQSTPAQRGTDGPLYRLLKLQEEAGEVAAAAIGFVGANKRKGFSHTEQDVASELCDVVITAMVALHDWTADAELLLKAKLVTLKDRIEREGS